MGEVTGAPVRDVEGRDIATDYGGGMSAAEARVNRSMKGRTIGNMGAPKVATMGADTSGAAKNTKPGGGMSTTPVSPCADYQSRNCGEGDKQK